MRAKAICALLVLSLPRPGFTAEHGQAHGGHEANHGRHAHEAHGAPAPLLTDELRRAAFPDVGAAHAHMAGDPFAYLVLFDRLEVRGEGGDTGLAWGQDAWFGHDFGRLWIRSEGERGDGHTRGDVEALWGRPVARWWDVLAGLRHDFAPGGSRQWLALGVIGKAPYHFDIEATAYMGESGRTALQLEAGYDLLLTQRLIAQTRIEVVAYGRADPELERGSGLSSLEAGLRLRYEVRREFAPYLGAAWSRKLAGTGRIAERAGQPRSELQWVAGLRLWF